MRALVGAGCGVVPGEASDGEVAVAWGWSCTAGADGAGVNVGVTTGAQAAKKRVADRMIFFIALYLSSLKDNRSYCQPSAESCCNPVAQLDQVAGENQQPHCDQQSAARHGELRYVLAHTTHCPPANSPVH